MESVRHFPLILALLNCGGVAVLDPTTDAADASLDISTETSEALDAGLPPCKSTGDCFGAESCQDGWCCAGTLVGSECACGDGPGCDLQHWCAIGVDGGQSCIPR